MRAIRQAPRSSATGADRLTLVSRATGHHCAGAVDGGHGLPCGLLREDPKAGSAWSRSGTSCGEHPPDHRPDSAAVFGRRGGDPAVISRGATGRCRVVLPRAAPISGNLARLSSPSGRGPLLKRVIEQPLRVKSHSTAQPGAPALTVAAPGGTHVTPRSFGVVDSWFGEGVLPSVSVPSLPPEPG